MKALKFSSRVSANGGAALSLKRFLRLLLLRDTATRQEIGRLGGYSSAAVTLSSQWLLEHDFLVKSPVRVDGSKRPVEILELRPLTRLLLAIRLGSTGVASDLLDSTGAVLASFRRENPQATQAGIFEALGEELILAQARAEEFGKPLGGIVLSVDGLVSEPTAGIIFRLNGLLDWVPCAPKAMHPAMRGFNPVIHWTQAVCKLYGLARRLKTDSRIAFFDVRTRDVHFAIMHHGVVTLGGIGTSGSFLHQSIQADGPACYCGRPGCLDALLRVGKAPEQLVFGAILRLLEDEGIHHLGLEWHHAAPAGLSEAIGRTTLRSLVQITDGGELERQGLALLGIEAALLEHINALQRPRGQS